ncbi:protein PIH1D3-like [Argonauta hians]
MAFPNFDIRALADLLKPPKGESDSDSDTEYQGSAYGPGHIGPQKDSKDDSAIRDCSYKEAKDIWNTEEIPEGSEYDSLWEQRPQPEYTILYNQDVRTEDVFLQLGNKTPCTSSCERMIVKIQLPNTLKKDISLDVKPKFLDLRTPKYKLGLHLPYTIKENESQAEWDEEDSCLKVSLKLVREYDFLNF